MSSKCLYCLTQFMDSMWTQTETIGFVFPQAEKKWCWNTYENTGHPEYLKIYVYIWQRKRVTTTGLQEIPLHSFHQKSPVLAQRHVSVHQKTIPRSYLFHVTHELKLSPWEMTVSHKYCKKNWMYTYTGMKTSIPYTSYKTQLNKDQGFESICHKITRGKHWKLCKTLP